MTLAVQHLAESHARAVASTGKSSFYLAMQILRREQRAAMFEIYSFCRAVDDIADSEAPRGWRLERLAEWRDGIGALYRGEEVPGLEGLGDAIRRFSLREEDFIAVIDGMQMDASGDIRAPDLAQLELYCDRVACAVGRMSVQVFGMQEREGKSLAHHLGRALQLTNILRDLDEDAALGRLYLPGETLRLAGIAETEPLPAIMHPNIGLACKLVADWAKHHFAKADAIMSRSPRHVVRAPRIMAEVYGEMLDGMIARDWAPPRPPIHAHKSRLLWIALRHVFD